MLINKKDKSYQKRMDLPNSNWLGEEWYLVPDNTDLANKIIQLYPKYNFVLDENNNLIDVVGIPKTEEEIKQERVEKIHEELNTLDTTINRATEDLYVLTNTTPYQTIQEVINKKEELRKELHSLAGENNDSQNTEKQDKKDWYCKYTGWSNSHPSLQ